MWDTENFEVSVSVVVFFTNFEVSVVGFLFIFWKWLEIYTNLIVQKCWSTSANSTWITYQNTFASVMKSIYALSIAIMFVMTVTNICKAKH